MSLSAVQHATALAGAVVIVYMCEGGSALGMQASRDTKAPPPSVAGASVAGTVVTADSARPLRRAAVTLTGLDPRSVRTVQTDDQGGFRFSGLPAGEYALKAMKGGYLESIYGQKHPGSGRPGISIRLAEDQQLSRLSIPLPRGGVITGVVLDETGEPAFGISVRALRWSMQSGMRSLSPGGSATTDDRGIYRIHSLVPGEYLVSASTNNATIALLANEGVTYVKMLGAIESATADGIPVRLRGTESAPAPTSGFATVYYPGTTIGPAATSVTIGPGEERPGVDIPLQIVPLASIAGIVTSTTGPAGATSVQLIDSTNMLFGGARTARVDSAGRFTFEGVAPGQYRLTARGTARGAPQLEASGREAAEFLAAATDKARIQAISSAISAVAPLWATTDVVVDGRNQTDLRLLLQPGLTVSGQIAFETGAPAANVSRLTVGLTPVGGLGDFAQTGPASVDANGQFTVRGVIPGRYRLSILAGLPAGYHPYSALFGGQDILDVPLEIDGSRNVSGGVVTLSNRQTEVSGVIQNGSGRAELGFTVIAFPAEERLWTPGSRRIQAARPASDGRYQFRNLPPGDYRLIAVPDVEPGRWFDPAFLRQLAGFASFTLGAGARHTQDFQIR